MAKNNEYSILNYAMLYNIVTMHYLFL